MIGRGIAPYWLVAAMIAVGALSLAAYVRHANANAGAILDLKLLKIPTFYAGVVGGFIFRIGIGAMPFLLPLLLQVGFGLTPFESGSLTFATAAGALLMKFTASTALRWFGFRQTLVVNGLISGAFLGACALFTPSTPHWLLLLMLLTGGFFRSLEFTALNAISYADIDPPQMSRATSFASVSQQMSGAVGVAVAAICVELDPGRLRRFRAYGARPLARLRPGGDRLEPLGVRLRPAQARRGRGRVGPAGLDQRRARASRGGVRGRAACVRPACRAGRVAVSWPHTLTVAGWGMERQQRRSRKIRLLIVGALLIALTISYLMIAARHSASRNCPVERHFRRDPTQSAGGRGLSRAAQHRRRSTTACRCAPICRRTWRTGKRSRRRRSRFDPCWSPTTRRWRKSSWRPATIWPARPSRSI